MNTKVLMQRLGMIGGVVLLAAAILYFRGIGYGLDIQGGVSLIYEIERTPQDPPNLAEQMKELLAKRVDPAGVYNLTWRVHGSNRLEVQMPLPPKEAQARREAYDQSVTDLINATLRRGTLESILGESADQRAGKLANLARGALPGQTAPSLPDTPEVRKTIADRESLLQLAAQKYDEYQAARVRFETVQTQSGATTTTAPSAELEKLRIALRDATEELDSAYEAVLATQFDSQRFREALDLAATSRDNVISELKQKYPELASKMDVAQARYTEWQRFRGFLDGPQDLKRLLKGAGVLEFRILAEQAPENQTKYSRLAESLKQKGGAFDDTYEWYRIDNPIQFFSLDSAKQLEAVKPPYYSAFVIEKKGNDYYVLGKKNVGMLNSKEKGWQLKRAYPTKDQQGRPEVAFELDVRGGSMFGKLTMENINKQLCILVDDVAYSSANIRSKITTSGVISGDFSLDKVTYLVKTMQAGALPGRLKETPVSERVIGSSLGEENRQKAINSGIIGSILVVVMMVGYYMKTGWIAIIAVAINVLLTLAMMSLLGVKMTLDGMAGIILSIGMAVDANVLINERMREEKLRGASLRVCIKNGYDRAFRAILDGHVTTLLASLIIYYAGSQEIRGFGLTLGWGIALSLFTSVVVTRAMLEAMVHFGWAKELRMLSLIKAPSIDWYSLRRIFVPLSIVITVGGLAIMATRSPRDYLDVEFLGGTSATIELKAANLTDPEIAKRLTTSAKRLGEFAQKLAGATVEQAADSQYAFNVRAEGLDAPLLAAFLGEPLEDANLVVRDGVQRDAGGKFIRVTVKESVTVEQVRSAITAYANRAKSSSEDIANANIASVLEGDTTQKGRLWEITTTETNKSLVSYVMIDALGDSLKIQQRVEYVAVLKDGTPFPIVDRRAENVIPAAMVPAGTTIDLTDFLGGAAIVLDQVTPPQSIEELSQRFGSMRLQPDYQDLPWRKPKIIGLTPAGTLDGNPTFSRVLIAVADTKLWYATNPGAWRDGLAMPELAVAKAALDKEQALRKVSQFKPQIAARAQSQAVIAIVLSWAMIIIYLWIRFGKPMYGVAGVLGLVHTVLIALAFVGIAGYVTKYARPLADLLLIENFKVNMPVLAALLTLIGYAINDTIVTFDRIRELRGRLGIVTPQVINQAINECMSRTLLTGTTVFLTIMSMYVFGGSSIRGFNFCMAIGVIAGTYSSIAIATPLLLLRGDRPDAPVAPRAAK